MTTRTGAPVDRLLLRIAQGCAALGLVAVMLGVAHSAGAGSYQPTCEEQPSYEYCIPVESTTTTAPPTTTEAPSTTTTEVPSTTVPAATTTVAPSTTVIVSEPPVCIDNPNLEGCPPLPPKTVTVVDVPVAPPAVPTSGQPKLTG